MALAEPLSSHSEDLNIVLPRGLAARFGGSCADYKVASFSSPRVAVFFPNWVARESAIARSPFKVEDLTVRFSNWVEIGEAGWGHLRHKAWVPLHQWPILCWNEKDVVAAVSGFGALWEVDEDSERMRNVSFYRVNVRCQHIRNIPKTLHLYVEDRRFTIPVEIESWEEANPILLGETLD